MRNAALDYECLSVRTNDIDVGGSSQSGGFKLSALGRTAAISSDMFRGETR